MAARHASAQDRAAAGPVAWETFAHVRSVGNDGSKSPVRLPTARRGVLDWLNSLISTMVIEDMLFGRFEVDIECDRLAGAAFGEVIDAARHKPAAEVKGATFTELQAAHLSVSIASPLRWPIL